MRIRCRRRRFAPALPLRGPPSGTAYAKRRRRRTTRTTALTRTPKLYTPSTKQQETPRSFNNGGGTPMSSGM